MPARHVVPERVAQPPVSPPACGGRGDPLVGRGERDPHVPCPGGAVELARRHQDAPLGQPATVSQHGSSRVAQR